MQKLVLFVCVFVLPLLRAQQNANSNPPQLVYHDSCSAEDRAAMDRIEAVLRTLDPVVLGPPRLPSGLVLCFSGSGGEGGGWAGFDGTFAVQHLGELGIARFTAVYIHERGHFFLSRGGKSAILEGLTQFLQFQSETAGGFTNQTPSLLAQLQKAQVQSWSGTAIPLDYGLALRPFFILGAANASGSAINWAWDGTARLVLEALKPLDVDQYNGNDHKLRLAQLKAIAAQFPNLIDGQDTELWLRQQTIFRGLPGLEVPVFEVWLDGYSRSGIFNPNSIQPVQYGFEQGIWQQFPVTPNGVQFAIMDSIGQGMKFKDPAIFQFLGGTAGAYNLEVLDSNGSLLNRQQFVRWNGASGLTILKTDWDGRIGEFPIQVGNAKILHDGQGFAVVEPYCKDVRPCNITVSSPDMLETFTVMTPGWQNQVIRLNNRRPVFNLPETISLAPGESVQLDIRNLVEGIPSYSWTLTSSDPAIQVDRKSGEGDGTATVSLSPAVQPGRVSTLRFECPQSVDTPWFITVRVSEPPKSGN